MYKPRKYFMSNLTELTAQIITARAAKKDMSTDELQQEMQMFYSFLKVLRKVMSLYQL